MDTRSLVVRSEVLLRELEQTETLFEPFQFSARAEARDQLELHVLDALTGAQSGMMPGDLAEYERIRREAVALSERFERIDAELLAGIRAAIRSGQCRGETLWKKLEQCLGPLRGAGLEIGAAYDYRDDFIDGLLRVVTDTTPGETMARDEEMVAYQPTPARVLFTLLGWVPVGPNDVFYDLGCGLGRVAIMARLLTDATVQAIEVEPTYCAYARQCALELGVDGITFLNEDARQSDYHHGTVFYLYTPFRGQMLQAVLDRLRDQAMRRRISICTFGPCTAEVSQADWHRPIRLHRDTEAGLGVFEAPP